MIEDETPVEGGDEAVEPTADDEALAGAELSPEAPEDGEPTDGTGEDDDAPEGDPEAPQDLAYADSETAPEVNEVEASVDPEAHLGEGVEVNENGEVQSIAPESISSEDGGETEVLSGDVEPEALNSGDVLPAHRRQVEGV